MRVFLLHDHLLQFLYLLLKCPCFSRLWLLEHLKDRRLDVVVSGVVIQSCMCSELRDVQELPEAHLHPRIQIPPLETSYLLLSLLLQSSQGIPQLLFICLSLLLSAHQFFSFLSEFRLLCFYVRIRVILWFLLATLVVDKLIQLKV